MRGQRVSGGGHSLLGVEETRIVECQGTWRLSGLCIRGNDSEVGEVSRSWLCKV